MAFNLECRVHPVVLFGVVDSYERRNEDAKRVIGTLLGTCDKGVVEVTNCFAVPHNESEDEVAVDIEYAKNIYDLHRKVNPLEVIVGWYSTGPEVSAHSVLIHEYYAREAKNAIHLTVDTSLRGNKMGLKAFTSSPMGVPGQTVGHMFTPVHVIMTAYEPEKVGVQLIQQGKLTQSRSSNIVSDLHLVEAACGKVQHMLKLVMDYVDRVLDNRIAADNSIGRFLMDLVHSVPQIEADQFEEMLNSNMKDLLMVLYLSNLTETQLTLSQKLALL